MSILVNYQFGYLVGVVSVETVRYVMPSPASELQKHVRVYEAKPDSVPVGTPKDIRRVMSTFEMAGM